MSGDCLLNEEASTRLAMNAARSGFSERAIDFLLDDNFKFDDMEMVLGTEQVPSPYFPGIGSYLYAYAFMAAGWDDGPSHRAPGLPSLGSLVGM